MSISTVCNSSFVCFIDKFSIRISPSDPRWVGAWWMIFIPGAICGAISVFIIGWWPRELPSKTDIGLSRP